MITLLFILAFNIGAAVSSSITALTLFEFGKNRLVSGSTTLPLYPLGTANGNSETTYLYEIINSVEGQNFVEMASRTLVVSASGWMEIQPSASIICEFINSAEGECFGATTGTATGTPTPRIFQVANPTAIPGANPTTPTTTPATSSMRTATIFATITASTTANGPNGSQNSPSPPVGAIAGSTIAGVVVISAVVFVVLWRRKRRLRRQALHVMPHQAAGAIDPYLVPLWSTQSVPARIPSQTQNGIDHSSAQPKSKRTLAMASPSAQDPRHPTTNVVERMRRPEEHNLPVSGPPPYGR
ncbi:hypothetical protein BDP27DRAFT_1331630 [Rhodocollybia butyracea]|uniref:Uncharacterized protein n=1 Tax=Rhodocollybia butyracea TaxID=206335 RepID=A0A9P5PHX5_9AGAR|nr:hypothetical protein BDP27DRAFT_1331630 [Rhodocollybia butyracea]